MSKKIAIIGNGNVGGALTRGLTKARREVKNVGKDMAAIRSAVEWADIVVLAVPFGAVTDVATTIASLVKGKTVVDATNALTAEMQLAVGFTTSGAEELQKKLPQAHVVKTFNTQFAQHMDSGRIGEQRLTVFVAGDDAGAKADATDVATAIGFEAVDAGPLANARLLEPLGYLNIQLGYVLRHGTQIGLRLVRG